MNDKFKESVGKWDPKLKMYLPFAVPAGATLYEEDMNKVIRCAGCGKEHEYGNCFTSLHIHTRIFGHGYMVCPVCYEKEVEAERNKFN